MHRAAILVLLIVLGAHAGAQEFSERQEIAVFRLSYYGQPVSDPPPGLKVEIRGRRTSVSVELRGSGNRESDSVFQRAFGAIDEHIRSVFIDLGRFTVIGMDQRLTQGSVSDFINVLTEFRRSQTELPEAVLLGQETFTEADFRELVGGFVVVVPSVSWYSLRTTDDGRFAAEIETSFTFINVEDLTSFAQFFVTTTGIDENRETAIKEAVDSIPGELSFRVRSLPEFQIKTGVLEVDGRSVILEFGRNMGIRPGDEYAVVSTRVLSTGHIAKTETGLILIEDVQDGFSTGTVLYASPRVTIGDQLQEVPRRGVEISPYVDAITNGLTGLIYTVGARGIASRGFYRWRPLAGLEIPIRGLLVSPDVTFLPVNLFAGGEFNLVLGRLRISPNLAVGVGGAVPLGENEDLESFYLSHIGVQAKMTGSVLISRDFRAFVDVGFAYWASVYGESGIGIPLLTNNYGGLLIGAGVTFK